MFIDTVSDGIHPKVLNVRNHPSVSFKWKTSLLFYYFIHMLSNLICGAWLPDSHAFKSHLRRMTAWFAFHWNAVWKCSFQWMPFIQSIHAFQSHWRRMTAWRIPTPLLIGLTICGVAGAHLYHHDIYQTWVWNHWITNRIILRRF